jgi:CheY-like chemotaxis protein
MTKIVVCEDDPMIRKLVQTALRATSHEVHYAVDGAACLALIADAHPDVVFSDISMPELDGFQVADAVHAQPDIAHIPIVFMSASVRRDQIAECFKHGAAGHIAKPFTMAELRGRLAQFSKS